jgi:hypothetical protein
MNCETIGCLVMGMVCDAGGNNARLFKLLRMSGTGAFPNEAWVGDDAVRCVNPFDTSRYIYLMFCATHVLKAMRNQLFSSWVHNGTREFLCEAGHHIGKAILVECYERDADRQKNGFAPLTTLSKDTIDLNKWSKMNVSHTKKCVELKTLVEMANHCYDKLGVPHQERLKIKESENGNRLGFMVEVAEHLRQALNVREAFNDLPANLPALHSSISSLEWLAHVHEIFDNRLMNMNFSITRENIDRYEEQVKKSLDYFHRLWLKQQDRRSKLKPGDDSWQSQFLASKTWLNLRTTCCGFFGYCRNIFQYADSHKDDIACYAISPAHSNSSVIEAWFSLVRGCNGDSATNYCSFVKNVEMIVVKVLRLKHVSTQQWWPYLSVQRLL